MKTFKDIRESAKGMVGGFSVEIPKQTISGKTIGGGKNGVLIKPNGNCGSCHLVVSLIRQGCRSWGQYRCTGSSGGRNSGSRGGPTSHDGYLSLDFQEVLAELNNFDSQGIQLVVVGLQQTTAGSCQGEGHDGGGNSDGDAGALGHGISIPEPDPSRASRRPDQTYSTLSYRSSTQNRQ